MPSLWAKMMSGIKETYRRLKEAAGWQHQSFLKLRILPKSSLRLLLLRLLKIPSSSPHRLVFQMELSAPILTSRILLMSPVMVSLISPMFYYRWNWAIAGPTSSCTHVTDYFGANSVPWEIQSKESSVFWNWCSSRGPRRKDQLDVYLPLWQKELQILCMAQSSNEYRQTLQVISSQHRELRSKNA
jgi:hypothetical protein